VLRWLEDVTSREALMTTFDALHKELRCNASQQATQAIIELVSRHDGKNEALS
jgi:lipid A disaccharide synthetase